MTSDPLNNPEEKAAQARVRQLMEPDRPWRPGETVVPESPAPQSAPELPATDVPATSTPVSGTSVARATVPADDPATDKAVEDITKHEADDTLRLQDEAAETTATTVHSGRNRLKRFWSGWWGNPRTRYGSLVAVVAILITLAVIPFTRYSLLGLFLKRSITVTVVDSKTSAPVSGALVRIGGEQAKSDVSGTATLQVRLGRLSIDTSKKYYRSYEQNVTVTLSATDNHFHVPLEALGRQVPVKVVNKVTGQPLANAAFTLNGSETKTDKDGVINLVLPSAAAKQSATLALDGYNPATVTVAAADKLTSANTFKLTPAGKLYFLSDLSGKIDVVKTNLDGSDRQTVLAGTGNEDSRTTSLLASRDWKYLALLSKRAGTNATLYLIDTTNGDKLATIDEGNADFNLIGWSGDHFIYQVTRHTILDWQPHQQALKSYDATTGQTLLLDQTTASGTTTNDYMKQDFGSPYLMSNQVVYTKGWEASYADSSQVVAKSAELDSIGVDGSGHKVIKTFLMAKGAQSSGVYITAKLYEPNSLYVYFSDGNQDNFYEYENGKLSTVAMTADTFFQNSYPTYLLSPSGNQTFWAEPRDGKNTLFIGGVNAGDRKQIASLSSYNTYGWYTDNYLLVSKDSSELYIMPASGGAPLKVTDYYKPAINYNGYGGGYGGL